MSAFPRLEITAGLVARGGLSSLAQDKAEVTRAAGSKFAPAETLLMVSGKGKIEMKDAQEAAVAPADYVYLPGKHPHQFSYTAWCTFFDISEGAFDIHYISKDGKEIPPDQALAPAKKL